MLHRITLPFLQRTLLFLSLTYTPSLGSANDLQFQKACDPGTQVTLSAVGDLLLHAPLQHQAFNHPERFRSLWKEAIPYFQGVDLSYANLEGPVAENIKCNGELSASPRSTVEKDCRKSSNSVYTSYPRFNYHPMLIDDLAISGIDVVSTANNHSLNRGPRGVDVTVRNLSQSPLLFSGTRQKTNSTYKNWYTLSKAKGKTIGWISCTYDTNGIPDPHTQVLNCFDDSKVEPLIHFLKHLTDATIITPHWGSEYSTQPNAKQRRYAQMWLEAGATAVIGSHPHVLQPWEKYRTQDGRETLIAYSLGNFVSNQSSFEKQTTILLFVGLTFRGDNVWVNGARYLPASMKNRSSPIQLLVNDFSTAWNSESEILEFLGSLFGHQRRLRPGEAITTNPECS